MMTQTHGLIAAVLLAGPSRSRTQNWAVLIGSLAPDLAIYALFVWSKIENIPERVVWQDIYFAEPMLTLTAIGNYLPLYCGLLFAALFMSLVYTRRLKTIKPAETSLPLSRAPCRLWKLLSQSALALFALAAMTHLLGDFPVHAADAHPHFWPFSDWRFHSPISYWDQNHYGTIFSYAEAVLGILLSVIVFRRFKSLYVRALIALMICAYLVVPLYFSLVL